MASGYNINDINLGALSSSSGHQAYLDAVIDDIAMGTRHPKKIIVKKNKHGQSQMSRFEVAFTQLAQLFLAKNLTSSQKLVINDTRDVVGVASLHLSYIIEKKEGLTHSFYILDNPDNCQFTAKRVDCAEQIPFYFLDKLPQVFFEQLLVAERENRLTIDYSSLASIFTASYALEEDDLHKGNFGFYVVNKGEKPEVVFFKIDHDLMFVDSIMSFYTLRPYHFFHGGHAFDVLSQDVLDFPNLTHSANSYWPTKLSFLSNPWNHREYHTRSEVEAFASLKLIPAFNKAKWRTFYKHILIPTDLVMSTLKECFDEHDSNERAQIFLIAQALQARQAQLRAVLFSIPEFREFVRTMEVGEKDSLLNEILASNPVGEAATISEQVSQKLATNDALCLEGGFEEGDTPLHIAIRLGDFRCEETMNLYGHLVNQPNKAGKTPLDIALRMALSSEKHLADVRRDPRIAMSYLIFHGAEQSESFKIFNQNEHIESYQFQGIYHERAKRASDYKQLKELLRDIGEDGTLCLKFKKNLAINCISLFITTHQSSPNLELMLRKLKEDIRNEMPELRFIRQLRTSLWIIRQIRGIYGWTSTQGEINTIIDTELGSIHAKKPCCFSFFNTTPVTTPMNVDIILNSAVESTIRPDCSDL